MGRFIAQKITRKLPWDWWLRYSNRSISAVNPCLVLAAICGSAASPPAHGQTTVELRFTSVDDGDTKLLEQSLRRELSDRLLQDGYRLVPDGEVASVGVWVHLGPEGARVQTRGTSQRVETVATGDPKVVVLEVLQLTTALVDEVRPDTGSDQPAVVLDLSGQPHDPQLEERLQIGLLERGFALTRQSTGADRRLCIVAAGDDVTVHVTAGDRACGPSDVMTEVAFGETVEHSRALLLDGAASALDEWEDAQSALGSEPESVLPPPPERAEVSPDTPGAEPEPASEPEPAPEFAPTSISERRVVATLAAHGGALGRMAGIDGLIGLRLRVGRRRGIGGGLELSVVPSSVEDLRIVEVMPTAVFDWRLAFARRGFAALGAVAGVHVHDFRHRGIADSGGVRVAPSLGTTVRLALQSSQGIIVFGGLRAGWSGGQWVHVVDGVPVWKRSALMVGLEVGMGWDFPWGAPRE